LLTAEAELASGTRTHVNATVYDRARCLPDGIRNFHGSTDVPVEQVVGEVEISIGEQEVWVPLSSPLALRVMRGRRRSIPILRIGNALSFASGGRLALGAAQEIGYAYMYEHARPSPI
jgi:hypothetical protein